MTSLRFNQRLETLSYAGFAGMFLVFLFFYATMPIADPDFWWHLKTGETMLQNGGLLQFDPFTFSGDGDVSSREALILKGYWLWELAASGLYSFFGFYGIFLLNFLTVGTMVGVVFYQMRRQHVGHALTVVLLTLGFTLLRDIYPLERPQVISFLLAAVLVGSLTRVRDGGQLGWTLPVLMLLWANLHGGFVVGDLMLVCFAAGAIIEYRHDFRRLWPLLLWVGVSIVASFINPNGALAFVEILTFQNSELMTGVSEYQSTWIIFQNGDWSVVVLWLLIVLYGVGVWSTQRFYWPEMIVALFLAFFSAAYMRNVGFFAVAMLPLTGFHLQSGKLLGSWRIAAPFKYIMVFISVFVLLWQTNGHWVKRQNEGIVNSFYPADSAHFILTSGLQGRMLNSYNFGGYQIWRFYPQHLVFIDGRGLDPAVYSDWKLMVSASLSEVGERKEFEVLLDRYGIDYVVQPHVFLDTGRLTPLLKFLLVKQEWIPVYADYQCFILVRMSPQNASVIEKYKLEKRDFNNKVIGFLVAYCNTRPTEVIHHVALAEMLIFVGRYDEAENRLDVIASLQPGNPNLPSLRNQLNVLKNGKKL